MNSPIELSLSDSRLDPFRDLRGGQSFENGIMVADSAKVILKLLDSTVKPLSLLATPQALAEKTIETKNFGEVFTLNKNEMSQLLGYRYHQGFIALAQRPAPTPLDQLGPHILILNSLTSPENVGTLIRTAAGLGITDIIFDHETCHPHVRRAVRVSMGSVFFMRWHHTYDLASTIAQLGQRNIPVIGGANDPGSVEISKYDWKGSGQAILIGSEGHGISDDLRRVCHKLVFIPMKERVAHFNAAAAGAILMYEMTRSRSNIS